MTRQAAIDASRSLVRVAAIVCAAVIWGVMLLPAGPARAVVELDITQGNIEPLPIAIPAFTGQDQDAQLAGEISGVISADLVRSGLFRALDPASFIEKAFVTNIVSANNDITPINQVE